MRLCGLSIWSRSCTLAIQAEAHARHGVTAIYVCDQTDAELKQRDAAIKSLRKKDGVGVLGLNCLAVNKYDLRWAAAEIFKRGAYIYVYDDKNGGIEIWDTAVLEATLIATEIWAEEARHTRPRSASVAYGEKGGRPPTKLMPKDDARIYLVPIWRAAKDAIEGLKEVNRETRKRGFKKYSRMTAYRHLGPRNARDNNTLQ